MRKKIDLDVADENLTGFASNVTGASFTITTTAASDGLAHKVSIRNDAATDHSAKTVTLVGTDPNGVALTEVVTGPGASATVQSTGYFLTLTTATPSATIGADTFDIGWVDEVATRMIPVDHRALNAASCSVTTTGTVNYTVQQTFNDILASTANAQAAQWSSVIGLSAEHGATAVRLITHSYLSGATLEFHINQSSGCCS